MILLDLVSKFCSHVKRSPGDRWHHRPNFRLHDGSVCGDTAMPPQAWLLLSLMLSLLAAIVVPTSLYGDDRGVTAAARAEAAAARAKASATAPTLVLKCPALITQTTDKGQSHATLAMEPAVATTSMGSSWHVQPHAWSQEVLFGKFPLGKTDVGYLAIDTAAEASATCSTTVEVIDREAPVLRCPYYLETFKLSLRHLTELGGNISVVDNSGEQLQATCGTSPESQQELLCTAQDKSLNVGTCTIDVLPTRREALIKLVLSSLGADKINLTLAWITLTTAMLCAGLLRWTSGHRRLTDDTADLPGTPFSESNMTSISASASRPPFVGNSPCPSRNIEALWEKAAPQHTPLQLPPKQTPNTVDVMRTSVQRNRLESEVRWLADQLSAVTARHEEDASYMQKALDSERQQLQNARTELIELKEDFEAKLNGLQEKLTSKEREFRARDKARAEQFEALMDTHTADRSRLVSSVAKTRDEAEAALAAREADKVQIFELKSSLAKMQDSYKKLQAETEESALQAAAADARNADLNSIVEQQKDAFFQEAKAMEASHAAASDALRGALRQQVDNAEAAAEQERVLNAQNAKQIAALEEELQSSSEHVAAISQELRKSQADTTELRSTVSALRDQLDGATADALNDKTDVGASEQQNNELKLSLQDAELRIEELTTQLDARDASLQESKMQVTELECKVDTMKANIGTLEAKLSTAVQREEHVRRSKEDELATLQMQMHGVQSSLAAATQEIDRTRESEHHARELWREGEKQAHSQLEMLEAMHADIAQLRKDKVAAEEVAAAEAAATTALRVELEALTRAKASIVSTIATQTSPLKARKSTSNVLSEKLATLQKQAVQMREDTIHLLGQGPTVNSATSGGQALVLHRVVPDKLCIVTPGSGKQAPPKKPRLHQPTPVRVISAPMESPSPPRLLENQPEELEAVKSGKGQSSDFFDRNPGIEDAVDSPMLSTKRRSSSRFRSVSPTTPYEASAALRELRAKEQNRATRPPPVPAAAVRAPRSPSAVPIPNTPLDSVKSVSNSRISSSRWGAEIEAAVEEVVWPAEKRTTTSATGKPSLSDELTWLHSPGV